MNKSYLRLGTLVVLILMSVPAVFAQLGFVSATPVLAADGGTRDVNAVVRDLPSTVSPPTMSPELALHVYEQRQQQQSAKLAAYSDQTVMVADLPDTKQKGEYELQRSYAAPNSLKFKPVKFTGDNFVKNNVLVRLLQSEVDHTVKQESPQTAINESNYKFNHKSMETLDGRKVYVFNVKPHKKRVGLFKGKVYIDASSGALVRAEGQMVKSPSIFVRKMEFVQDYAEVAGFMLPTHIHSVAKVRIIGRTVVDIFHRDYQPKTVAGVKTASTGAPVNSSVGAN
jgi:hypothetical protein